MIYRYFVSFFFNGKDGGNGWGNKEITQDAPIDEYEDIFALSDKNIKVRRIV